jgi:hypothetical protein
MYFVIFLKYFIPVTIVFIPFLGGWANFILDTLDGDILIPLGLIDSTYQLIDKSADWFTYVGMVLCAHHFKWPIKKWIIILFIFRSLGQLAFFLSRDERVFFIFPNFLEPFFLIYASLVFLKKAKAYDFYTKHKFAIWLFVFIYKMQDEWITHIANIDRSEFLQSLIK